jgi:hemolysin activation/secretion protein
VAYDIPIGIYGIRLGGSILHSDSRPGDDRRQFDTQTLTDGYELKAAVAPLLNQRSSLWLAGSLGYLDASERDTFGLIYKDHVRTVGLTADYKFLDEIGGSNYLTAIFRQGLDVFGASQQGEDFLSRFGASGQFSVVDLAFSRYQRVTDEWSFKFSGAGQWSSSPLLNSQQFYLGGLSFGRGYGAGEVSGDNALAGSIEARFDQQVQTELLKGYQLYTFVDSGRVWNVGDSYSNGITLTSVGAGIRFYFPGEFQAGIAIAAPLTYRSPNNDGRDLQVLVSFSSALKVFCNKNNQWACL